MLTCESPKQRFEEKTPKLKLDAWDLKVIAYYFNLSQLDAFGVHISFKQDFRGKNISKRILLRSLLEPVPMKQNPTNLSAFFHRI